MTLDDVITDIIEPAALLLPGIPDNTAARAMLLSIGQQESRFAFRRQMGDGPARGFFQFERGGGVKALYNFDGTTDLLRSVCKARACPFDIPTIWATLETDDILACCLARLLLWSDPQPLPDDAAGGWALYARTWRPGQPHPESWDSYYQLSIDALGAA